MNSITKKERVTPCQPEWKIILKHLVYQDPTMVYRICRKMIIYLDRIQIPEINILIDELSEVRENLHMRLSQDANWPSPKGHPFIASDIIDKVFEIADKYLDDIEITKNLSLWIRHEHLSFLPNTLEKRNITLSSLSEVLKKYVKLISKANIETDEGEIGNRVAVILRLLSENLNYINAAKNFISLKSMDEILQTVVGPPLGNGKLGGKSAGLILAYQIVLSKRRDNPIFENIFCPKSWYITSDSMFEFVHYNALEEFIFTKYLPPERIKQEYQFMVYIFKNSIFPPEMVRAFHQILDDLQGKPIVVRSSSLLEDSFEASFSGKYKSLFLSNVGTKEERMSAFMNAVAEVYASVFSPDPLEYRKERGLLDFREEMGILVQEVVGNKIGKYFLPSYAGVAFCNNEFRWSHRIKRDDGVVRIVAGLGTRAVDRTVEDYPVLVSPGQPGIRINNDIKMISVYTQHNVDVINLKTNTFETIKFEELIQECHGQIPGLEKIVSFNRSGMLVEPLSPLSDFLKEDLVITFNNLISKSEFIVQIKSVLKALKEALGTPVDVEFASDGKKLYLLQCRPQSQFTTDSVVRIPADISPDKIIFTAKQNVSGGLVKNIDYVVYVDDAEYAALSTAEEMQQTGRIIGKLNRTLPHRKFILIGPGRWGSKGDIKLGVPVIYSDINNSAMLIEVSRERAGYLPELSFGTHFFQDLVEANIKYLPLYPDTKGIVFNQDFFYNSRNYLEKILPDDADFSKVIRVISVNDYLSGGELSIYMDGDISRAVAFIESTEEST